MVRGLPSSIPYSRECLAWDLHGTNTVRCVGSVVLGSLASQFEDSDKLPAKRQRVKRVIVSSSDSSSEEEGDEDEGEKEQQQEAEEENPAKED